MKDDDLCYWLRSLADCKHSDVSLAKDAANEIERLRAELAECRQKNALLCEALDDAGMVWPAPPWIGEPPIAWWRRNFDAFVFPLGRVLAGRREYALDDGPHESGLYFLTRGNDLVYIGQARSIKSRLAQHYLAESPPFFTHYWCFGGIPEMFISALEYFYIDWMNPQRNIKRLGSCEVGAAKLAAMR